MTPSSKLNIIIVDASPFYRKALVDIFKKLPQVNNVQLASNGESALQKLEASHFDLLLLDIDMPDLNGFEILKKISALHSPVHIVMMSSQKKATNEIALQALRAGAIDFIEKPTSNNPQENIHSLSESVKRILNLIHIHATTPHSKKDPPVYPNSESPKKDTLILPCHFNLIAIGSSTGGPKALNAILPHFPKNTNCPILIVQHITPDFTNSLAESLSTISSLPIKEASHDEPALKNHIYIAPGNLHMAIKYHPNNPDNPIILQLTDKPRSLSSRPSFDVLLESISIHPEITTLCIILTGMGSDGLKGISKIHREKRFCIAQDPLSCAIYGMPKAVIEHRLADATLSPEEMPEYIKTLTCYKNGST